MLNVAETNVGVQIAVMRNKIITIYMTVRLGVSTSSLFVSLIVKLVIIEARTMFILEAQLRSSSEVCPV